jgi:excisionase family DNA binding protein
MTSPATPTLNQSKGPRPDASLSVLMSPDSDGNQSQRGSDRLRALARHLGRLAAAEPCASAYRPRSLPLRRIPMKTTTKPRSTMLTVEDAAEHLGVSSRTVHRLLDTGELSKHQFLRCVRISQDDLNNYIARSRK